jgi:hypothetical protein
VLGGQLQGGEAILDGRSLIAAEDEQAHRTGCIQARMHGGCNAFHNSVGACFFVGVGFESCSDYGH